MKNKEKKKKKLPLIKEKTCRCWKKLNDHRTSYRKLINYLSREIKLISTKGSKIDLEKGNNILNGTKYFSENGSQNHFVFQPRHRYFTTLAKNVTFAGLFLKDNWIVLMKVPQHQTIVIIQS